VPFGGEQVLLGLAGVLVRDGLVGQRVPGVAGPPCGAEDAAAFALGGGGQPAGQRGRIAQAVQVVDEVEPNGLGGVIAQALFVSPGTVRKHLEHIYDKLDVRTRTQAAAIYTQERVVIDSTGLDP
jgi:hypothetical protein